MSGAECMIRITEQSLKEFFQREKEDLYSKVQTEFWRDMLWDVLQEHTFQTDFFLVRQDIDFKEAVEYLKNLVSNICQKYRLEFFVYDSFGKTEIRVWFHNYGILKNMHDELSLEICGDDITMRMLPHSPLVKIQPLEDYQFIGQLFQSLCEKLFGERLEDFVEYLESFKRIEECSKDLTPKSIEIAKNSIRTIYEASDEKFKNIAQKILYSSMLYKGERFRILHKEFLADPNILLKKLR